MNELACNAHVNRRIWVNRIFFVRFSVTLYLPLLIHTNWMGAQWIIEDVNVHCGISRRQSSWKSTRLYRYRLMKSTPNEKQLAVELFSLYTCIDNIDDIIDTLTRCSACTRLYWHALISCKTITDDGGGGDLNTCRRFISSTFFLNGPECMCARQERKMS